MFKRGGATNRWAGTVSDLLSVARIGVALLSQVANRDMTEEVRVHVDSDVYELQLEGLSQFEQEMSGDESLELVKRVTFSVGSPSGAAHIVLTFQRDDPAVVWGIAGWDRTWVEGGGNQLREAVAKGEQSLWWEHWLRDDLALLVASVSTGVLIVGISFISITHHGVRTAAALGVGTYAVALCLYLLLVSLMKRYRVTLEILQDGEQTAWRRARRKVQALVGSAAIILITAVATALATRLLG
jgi:hypothetical protein